MTDGLDAVLRARLERLARGVPVPPERGLGPVSVPSIGPRWRGRSSSSGLGALAAAVVVLVVILTAGSLGGGISSPSEVMATTSDGLFQLTLRSPLDRYAAQEPIEVVATLEYLGEEPSIEVYSHPGMPGFGVEEVDGANRAASPAARASCVTYSFRRGERVTFPFAKSGGFAPGEPNYEFMLEYLDITDGKPDPVLRLPAGTWRIFALADLTEDQCGGRSHELKAAITVVVGPGTTSEPSASSPSAAPSPAEPTPSVPPTIAPSPTLPPPQVAVPFPDGCAAYRLSDRRCAYIVAWAKQQAGIGADDPVNVELLGDPDCRSVNPLSCMADRTMAFVVRVRLTTPSGASSDHPVFCGIGGEAMLLCSERPRIQIGSPTSPMNGYHDIPCASEDGPCATPLPTIEPAAAAAAEPLDVARVDIPIDHIGSYSIPIGQAVLPNGILSASEFGLVDDAPTDVLLEPDGMFLAITSLDGGPRFDNFYQRGWHPGTERVQATLTFKVEWFEPGAVLHVTDILVR
jgi:hypothetical protein